MEEVQKLNAGVGESVTLSCSMPEVGSYSRTWTVFPRNENLTSHKHYKDRLEFTNDGLNVTITNLTKEDSGVYCCALKTVTKEVKRLIILVVIEPCIYKGNVSILV